MSITLSHIASLRATNSVDVTIRRGAQSCSLVAVPAASKTTVVGNNGSYTEVTVDDWLILVSDWTIQQPAYPQKGDDITIDGATDRYLVAHPDQQTPVYKNFNQLDRPAVAWRVHSVPR